MAACSTNPKHIHTYTVHPLHCLPLNVHTLRMHKNRRFHSSAVSSLCTCTRVLKSHAVGKLCFVVLISLFHTHLFSHMSIMSPSPNSHYSGFSNLWICFVSVSPSLVFFFSPTGGRILSLLRRPHMWYNLFWRWEGNFHRWSQ